MRSHNPPFLGPASSLAHCSVSSSISFITAQAHSYQILSALTLSVLCQPHGFKTHIPGRGFHTLINNVLFHSPRFGISQSTLLWTSLAHCLMTDSNTICNNPSPLITNIMNLVYSLAHCLMPDSNPICNNPSLLLTNKYGQLYPIIYPYPSHDFKTYLR